MGSGSIWIFKLTHYPWNGPSPPRRITRSYESNSGPSSNSAAILRAMDVNNRGFSNGDRRAENVGPPDSSALPEHFVATERILPHWKRNVRNKVAGVQVNIDGDLAQYGSVLACRRWLVHPAIGRRTNLPWPA